MISVGESCILVHIPAEGAYNIAGLPQPCSGAIIFRFTSNSQCGPLQGGNHLSPHYCQAWKYTQRSHQIIHPCLLTLYFFVYQKKTVAVIWNIITAGFGECGQVNLIGFQSIPDKFLLNYIDHGIMFLISIPIVAKRTSGVAYALLTIFRQQGAPKILQSDNVGKISQSAMDHQIECLYLADEEMDLIILENKLLWTECKLVCGSPRHSESNGGVECVNQTV